LILNYIIAPQIWFLIILDDSEMRIVHLNTFDGRGGAASASLRLHHGLKLSGTDSSVLVVNKQSAEDAVYGIASGSVTESVNKDIYCLSRTQEYYIDGNRTDISNTFFTLPYPGYDLSAHPLILEADLINLHWVAMYQSPVTLRRLFDLGKPVVWTLHDQWAFTGGCHYSAGCDKYYDTCSGCPQLADDSAGLPAAVLKDKEELFAGANLTIVTPSRWLADCAKRSRLFRDCRVECIPNSLDTGVFRPMSKEAAKAGLGIPGDTLTIFFGAEDGSEKRKGFDKLIAAVRHCLGNNDFMDLLRRDRIKILYAGLPNRDLESIEIPSFPLGYLSSDDKMSEAFSAADIFVLPSMEDNLPNTMIESLSCGTPVIAFNIGGIPDMVLNNVTGMLITPFDTKAFGDAICALAVDAAGREEMGRNGRQLALEQCSMSKQAERYLALYGELLGALPAGSKTTGDNVDCRSTCALDATMGKNFQIIFDKALSKRPGIAQVEQEVFDTCETHIAKCEAEANPLIGEKEKLQASILVYEEEIKLKENYLKNLKASRSWRITAPLRFINRVFMKMKWACG
jgi:glycosyltransferase involved in cell wall biosynthesis